MQKATAGIDWLAFAGDTLRLCDMVGTKLYSVLQNLQPKQRNLSVRHRAGQLAKKTKHRCHRHIVHSQHLKVKSASVHALRITPSLKGLKLENQANVYVQRSP